MAIWVNLASQPEQKYTRSCLEVSKRLFGSKHATEFKLNLISFYHIFGSHLKYLFWVDGLTNLVDILLPLAKK